MCGIAGYAHLQPNPVAPNVLERMCAELIHRGPDDLGLGRYGRVSMGMRRLSIIDLAGGRQPIESSDGQIAVTFNGEIYNYRSLRKELQDRGHCFRTHSDTEVIVYAYREFGDGFLNRLRGMFAICLLDRRTNRVLLARDQLGIKPLYYFATARQVVWGSEIKALLRYPDVPRVLDMDALAEFLRWEYVPAPGTLFRDIRKLEPGSLLDIDLTSANYSVKSYWRLADGNEQVRLEFDECVDALEPIVTHAVRQQLVSDVPLGAFLSGGTDSSLVVSCMGAANTFSIGFDDPSYDELAYASAVARHLNVNHTSKRLAPEVHQLFPRLMQYLEDPIADFSIFPTFLVSELTRKQVVVALSGDGGDELFGGYDTLIAQLAARRLEFIPGALRRVVHTNITSRLRPQAQKKGLSNKLKRFAEGFALDPALGHARWRAFIDDANLVDLLPAVDDPDRANLHIFRLAEEGRDLDPINRALYIDTRSYLVDNCLTKVDRMSMAVSLEVRVPLLDVDVVNFAFSVPGRLKVANGESKALLKSLAARKVPRECIYRTKQGFSIPVKQWLGGQFKYLLDRYLDHRRIEQQGIFCARTIDRMIMEHLSNKANHSHVLWGLTVFQAWFDTWYESSEKV